MPIPGSAEPFVIAVDAGGTHTRIGCFSLDGTLLSFGRGRGGSPNHNHDAAQNVASTMIMALESANLDPAAAVGLAAGMAGISRQGSNQGDGFNDWADAYFTLPSLDCPRAIVNDAVIAHRGALVGRPGVIVVAGTGSMILAITEDGSEIESGQFEHYAGAARHLVFDVMHRILAGAAGLDNDVLVPQVLEYWQARDLAELRQNVLRRSSEDRNDLKRRYGDLAPLVTAAAETSPIADAALRALTDKTATGIQVLAPLIAARPVPVAVTGSLACDPSFVTRLGDSLDHAGAIRTRLVEPALDPLGGAALMAYEVAGVEPGPMVIKRLAAATAA